MYRLSEYNMILQSLPMPCILYSRTADYTCTSYCCSSGQVGHTARYSCSQSLSPVEV